MDKRLLEPLAEKIKHYEGLLKDLYDQKAQVERDVIAKESMLKHYRAVYEAESGEPLVVEGGIPPKKSTIAEAATLVLQEEGGPLSASEITRRIQKRGLSQLSSKNAISTVISIMRRKPSEFDALGEGLYCLKVTG